MSGIFWLCSHESVFLFRWTPSGRGAGSLWGESSHCVVSILSLCSLVVLHGVFGGESDTTRGGAVR
ncbi:hypothetical protein [Pasteuria penetrans]|uniref:hypothetical protein n=1 Tax=Pasteuria penetrans TaxID=86005 RepID=UPI0011EBEC98|nr:hypothetical protein [Pasteuria penetrans]